MATIQMVGNKTRGEGLSGALTLADVTASEDFLKQSVNIATFLYDQSIHPNIRSGELYALLLECEYKKETVEAIAILKSERKDPFLATDNDGREISVRTIYGTGLKGLDKGCLVLNIDREKGYVVGTWWKLYRSTPKSC